MTSILIFAAGAARCATAAGFSEASSVLNAAAASASTAPQSRSKVTTSRCTSKRSVDASVFLSSTETMLARSA